MNTSMQKGVRTAMIVAALWAVQTVWAAAEADAVRTVQGEVVAVNLQSTPPVIVVKVVLPSKQAMIVGTTVESGVSITRGGQAIRLESITVGQTVRLSYVKNEEGLDARSIQVRN